MNPDYFSFIIWMNSDWLQRCNVLFYILLFEKHEEQLVEYDLQTGG